MDAPTPATGPHPGTAVPSLPDGLVAFVKRDCPTCELVAPVLSELANGAIDAPLSVFTQDDPAFPATADWVVHDHDLAYSWHHDIVTVPTLMWVSNGAPSKQIEGWDRNQWQEFIGHSPLGAELPDWRPGCGSLSVDPNLSDELAVRFSGSSITSRRVEIAELEDEWEAAFDRGWSDGLPVVPPTEARVLRMLEGTSRAPDEVVAIVPPNLAEVTVEKVAVNAVLAGCRPDYLPVVIAALEAVCTDDFNMHGVLATTMPVAPMFVVNGPVRHELAMNSGLNLLGQGNRANSTIGRAVQLIVRNVGGGRPGEIDRSTHGSPIKFGLAFAEDEEGSPWSSLAQSQGIDPAASAVTAITAESPRLFYDEKCRSAASLTDHLAQTLRGSDGARVAIKFDTTILLGPEHMSRYRSDGWDRDRFLAELAERLQIDASTIVYGTDGIEEGLPDFLAGSQVPKFSRINVVHGGGTAGLFSMIFGGWVTGAMGSIPTTKEIIR